MKDPNFQDLVTLACFKDTIVELRSRSATFSPDQLFVARKLVERLSIDTEEQRLICAYLLQDLCPSLSPQDAKLAIDYSIQEYM